jgi:hypothetical protein
MVKVSRFRAFIRKHQKSAPIIFFILGFTWDSLTLGSIDRLYDRFILCLYLASLSGSLYIFNLSGDGKWKETFLEKYEEYFPLAIQFFLGGLCSAYVIFFFRSVSYTKTISFFLILVVLLFANELLKKRISNKYLQFGTYFFVNFTFFTFFVPVILNVMNGFIFLISGAISLSSTLFLVTFIYGKSPSTRAELSKTKLIGLIISIYAAINIFYYYNLIPPVPLALQEGLVAHNIEKENNQYMISYQQGGFFSRFDSDIKYKPGDSLFVFPSIFAPADLKKKVNHHWQWLNPRTEKWETADKIGFEITGGRDEGYRGYTYKKNMLKGKWKVDVKTSDNLILGRINFTVTLDSLNTKRNLKTDIY